MRRKVLAILATMALAFAKKAGTKMDKDLEGMDYVGSEKVFKEEPAPSDPEDDFDPEKNRQQAYDEYIRQYADQTKTGQSLWAGKEDKGIYWNLDVKDVMEHM
jgi:hypothetical protein